MHRFNATAIPPPYHLCPTSTYWRSIIPFNPNENFVSNAVYKSYSIKNIRRNRRNRNGGTGGTGTRNPNAEPRSAEPAEPWNRNGWNAEPKISNAFRNAGTRNAKQKIGTERGTHFCVPQRSKIISDWMCDFLDLKVFTFPLLRNVKS